MFSQLDELAVELENESLAGHHNEVIRRGQKVLSTSVESTDQLAFIRIARVVGQAYITLSRYKEALESLQIALSAAHKSEQTEQVCLVLIELAYIKTHLSPIPFK